MSNHPVRRRADRGAFFITAAAALLALSGCQRSEPVAEEKSNKLIQPVARMEMAAAAGAAAPAAAQAGMAAAAPAGAAPAAGGGTDGKGIHDKTCTVCHAAGVAGAPKLGDKAAWGPRLAAGVDGLTKSVIAGKGAMPPKGGNAALSDAEIKAAVEYMVAQSK